MRPPKFFVVALSAMGVSTLGQGLAFFRQVLIAAYFGVSREFDIYVMALALTTMVVFAFANTFDSSVVPRLVQTRTAHGELAARALAAAMFRWSAALGAGVTMLLFVVTPLLTPLFATGFDSAQRADLAQLILYFAPWSFLCLPYYAASARHKSQRSFNRVFVAEIVIGVVSIAFLFFFHGELKLLPLAYGVGYAAGLLALLPNSHLLSAKIHGAATRPVLRSIFELYFANQTGTATGVVDRHFQSLVPVGGIAAVNYSTQLVTGVVGLLTFREIFIVPLSESTGRDDKLERLIIGLLMLAIPAAGLIIGLAHEMVCILFQRGRFDANATALTASVLQIYVLTLIPAMVTTPLARMLQIVGRTNFIHLIYLANVIFLAVSGYVFIVKLGFGARGIAWMLVSSAVMGSFVTMSLIKSFGVIINWMRVGRYAVYGGIVASIAYMASITAIEHIEGAWPRLIVGGSAYTAVIAATYFAVRNRLRTISG